MANKPIKKFKSGSFEVSLWENEHEKEGKKFKVVSASLQKSWKKADSDDFERSIISGIAMNDIPKLLMLLSKAFEDQSLKVE
jgi:hypothetical protein